jgi:hypothetical protein
MCFVPLGIVQSEPLIGSCPVFPPNNIWNTPVQDLSVDPKSDAYVASIGNTNSLHVDFGAGLYEGSPIGIPYIVVPEGKPNVEIQFKGFGDEPDAFPDESDAGAFPIPGDAPIEGGSESQGDRHVIVIQEGTCALFELYKAAPLVGGDWDAVGSARFDLKKNDLRPEGWTSADAAGLPIFPGLVRYDEVAAGEIAHALRFTAPKTRHAFVWPARHYASESDEASLPPMGQRFRLKESFDISGFSPANKVVLIALQTYGMILADNGSPWFVSGAPDERWNNDELQGEMRRLKGSDFEAVDVSGLAKSEDSGAVIK